MKRISLLLLFALATSPAAQLVANGGFENILSTVTSLYPSGIGSAANWGSGGGSPDFYTNTSILLYGYTGAQQCFAGNACAGLLNAPPATNNNNTVQYEYLQTQLVSDLLAGVTYHVSFMAAWSDRSRVQVSDLGFHLSTGNAFNGITGASWLPVTLTPTYNNPNGPITTTNWLLYEADYTATGGERYLTIGNFVQSPSYFLPTFVGPNFSTSYFFIDNVSVEGAVPEPATIATAGAALVLVMLRRRRRPR